MPHSTETAPHDLLVACLCAQWCGTCKDYQALFHGLAQKFPTAKLLWIDVEDQSDLVDPIEVENFPTILIASQQHPLFFGTVLPHVQTLQRLIEVSLTHDSRVAIGDANVINLSKKLWSLEVNEAR
jgi:thiol-disulfide isomerase/thioredoxin